MLAVAGGHGRNQGVQALPCAYVLGSRVLAAELSQQHVLQIRAEGAQPGFVLLDQAGEKIALGGHLVEFVVFVHLRAPAVW